jgi:hypothetical protein
LRSSCGWRAGTLRSAGQSRTRRPASSAPPPPADHPHPPETALTAALPLRAPAASRGRWGTRVLVVGAALAATLLAAGTTAANATFSDAAAAPSVSVGTGTVAPATQVRVDASCLTTTTVIKRYYRAIPGGLGTSQYAQTQTSDTVPSSSNVQRDTTTTTWTNPTDFVTTQTIQDTELYATLRWTLSSAARVAGYGMTAHTSVGQFATGTTGPTATSMTGNYDASVTGWSPRLTIDTLTDYGWVGTSRSSNVVTC